MREIWSDVADKTKVKLKGWQGRKLEDISKITSTIEHIQSALIYASVVCLEYQMLMLAKIIFNNLHLAR